VRFEYPKRRKASAYAQRSVVMAKRGMVASSHVLASQSGLKVLLRGGNAVDAAVAMLFTLSVVEPHSVGLGGDAFALIWKAKERVLVGLNGSGRAPLASSIEWFKERGMNAIPERGILSVTVPGALRAWADALERCGTMTLSQVMEDAIVYAEEGFPVTEIIAGEWESAKETLERDEEGARVFLSGGRPQAVASSPCRPLSSCTRHIWVSSPLKTLWRSHPFSCPKRLRAHQFPDPYRLPAPLLPDSPGVPLPPPRVPWP